MAELEQPASADRCSPGATPASAGEIREAVRARYAAAAIVRARRPA